MIIFLNGPDDYRREKKKREIVEEFRKKRGDGGLDVFDFAEDGADGRFREFLRSQPLFTATKLAVLENIFEIEAKKAAALLKPIHGDASVQVLISEKGKPVKALAFLAEKPSISQKFETLAVAELAKFAILEAERGGFSLAPAAAQFLAAVYEGNTWALAMEIAKLSSFKKSVTRADLDSFGLETAPNYWALVNGVRSYDMKTRMFALEKLLAMNDPAAKIFNILGSLWVEKIPHMAEYDLAVKSGKIDYEEALLDLTTS